MSRQELPLVEFLDQDGARLDADPEPPRPRRVPRRWVVAGALTAALVLVTAVLARPSSLGSGSLPTGRAPSAYVRISGGLSVAFAGATLVVLERSGLRYVRSDGSTSTTPISPRLPDVPAALSVDSASGVMLAVTLDSTPTRILEFSSPGNQPILDMTWNQPVRAAAVYNSQIVLVGDRGAFGVNPGDREPEPIAGLTDATSDVVADPPRKRFIVAGPEGLGTFDGREVRFVSHQRLSSPTLAVVQGTIWLAGSRAGRAVLERLDPVHLLPTLISPVQSRLGRSATVVGVGSRVVWVRRSGTTQTVCVAVPDGTQQGVFAAVGPMTSNPGAAYAGGGRDYYARYQLHSCPG